jgi:hypothetical protein
VDSGQGAAVAESGDQAAAIVAVGCGAGVLVADCLGHGLPVGAVGHGSGDHGDGVGVAGELVGLSGGIQWRPGCCGQGGLVADPADEADGPLVVGTGTGGIPCGTGGACPPRSGRPEAPGCDEMS